MSGPDRLSGGLALGEVHLWRADLDVHRDRSEVLEFLCTPDERRRADDIPDGDRRARFVARKGLLRVLLGDYAQRTGQNQQMLASSAYAAGSALFALGRTARLGLGLAPIRAGAQPPAGVVAAEEALWIAGTADGGRGVATFVAVREAAGRAGHDLAPGSLAAALVALQDGTGPVPIGHAGLVLEVVPGERSVGCVVHDGVPLPCRLRTLGA